MPGVFYSQKKLKSMKLMKINTQGPFNLDNWLKFIKTSTHIPEDFATKEKIIERYPEIYEIILKSYIYNYDCKKNIIKQKFIVLEKPEESNKTNQASDNKSKEIKDESKSTKKPSRFQNNKFSKFNSDSNSKSGFKIYKPKQFKSMNVTNYDDQSRSNFSSKNKFTKNSTPMYSIVIKNLPNDYTAGDLKNELHDIFCEHILSRFNSDKRICKTSVLTNNNVVKGVAFIDFYKKEHMESILQSSERFKIGFNILNIEKKNKN